MQVSGLVANKLGDIMNINEIFNYLKNLISKNPEILTEVFNKENITLVASFLGIDGESLYSVIEVAPKILNGEIGLKEILPALIPVLISYFISKKLPPKKNEGSLDTNFYEKDKENLSNFDKKCGYKPENDTFSKNLDGDLDDESVDFLDVFLQQA